MDKTMGGIQTVFDVLLYFICPEFENFSISEISKSL